MARLVALGKPDSKGRYTRDLGWKINEQGRFVQHRFLLGKDRLAAEQAYIRLDRVWDAVQTRWFQEGRRTEKPLWDAVSLKIAQAVCRLEEKVVFASWEIAHLLSGGPGSYLEESKELFKAILELQRQFPFVQIALQEEEIQVDGRQGIEDERACLDSLLRQAGNTLFASLDAWQQHQEGTVNIERARVQASKVLFLKKHLADMPLSNLDNAAVDTILSKIRCRPLTSKGKPVSVDYARECIKAFRSFLDWLDGSGLGWDKPKGYKVRPVRIRRTPEENARKNRLPIYTREQLLLLWTAAAPLDRLYMLLALNCGFGAGELATLDLSEVHLDTAHPEYNKVGNWIFRDRNKTGAYGEWRLWPETVAAIQWYLQHHQHKEGSLIRNEEGKPVLYLSTGRRCPYFANRWARLTKVVRQHASDFPTLSFNKLKKTSGSMLRRVGASTETAQLHISHGDVGADPLLERYAQRDFRAVFKAQRRLRKYLQPLFDAVPNFLTATRQRRATKRWDSLKDQVRAMRTGGATYKQIHAKLGIAFNTIRLWTKHNK